FNCDDERLPTAIEQGSTLREVTWGVDSAQDLDDLAARLADVEGFKRTENTVECIDPNGMTIRFEQSFVKEVPELK
ncbi:glyoxalase, partial [Acinetobacter sp. 11520]|nr:glyoxalase [Acinetobacter sp. 11520]